MFFPLSKLIFFAITPSNFLILIGVLGAVVLAATRLRRTAGALVFLSLAGLAVAGLTPLSSWIALPLEDRFPAFVDEGAPIAGIIVLGGGVETGLSMARGQMLANDAGERHTAMADLARRYPGSRLVFSGGSGSIAGETTSEAEVIGRYADVLGLPRTRLIQEDRSRNTRENAAFTADKIQPKAGERWLLVTSAWHMPRSMGCFRKAGFDVVAYPVDYRTGGPRDAARFNSFASTGLLLLDLVAKEWVGLVAYKLAGYTDDWFPSPSPPSSDGSPSR
ncbi:YdcF family protein [uncultured Methylobacterium sp.]|uniref:YdcF family protein n=1 Tax=uncultured Methylobacterium sp. TaxID=157278 RepID=UPI0035C95414